MKKNVFIVFDPTVWQVIYTLRVWGVAARATEKLAFKVALKDATRKRDQRENRL